MKKIFTLLFCTAIISSAFADGHRGDRDRSFGFISPRHQEFRQPDRRNWNEGYQPHTGGFFRPAVEGFRPALHVNFIVYGNNQYGLDQRDAVIAQITSDYNYQAQQVVNDYNLSPDEKDYQINNLQAQEQQAIDNIYSQCGVPAPLGLRISFGRRYR
jgi:hypothetical protein